MNAETSPINNVQVKKRCINISLISSVQSLSPVQLFAALQASLTIISYQSPSKPMSIESVMPSSNLILCRPLLLLPPIPPSIKVFFNESTLHMRWPKYWSFSFSIIPSKEHPGLIFRMDWLDLFAGWMLVESKASVMTRATGLRGKLGSGSELAGGWSLPTRKRIPRLMCAGKCRLWGGVWGLEYIGK